MGNKKPILLLDDDENYHTLIPLILKEFPFIQCMTYDDAISKYKEQSEDIEYVFSDLNLKDPNGRTGYDFCQEIRDLGFSGKVFLITSELNIIHTDGIDVILDKANLRKETFTNVL